MKKLILFTLALLSFSSVMAVPAYKGVTRLQQPDGSYVSIRLHGDEYMSFNTTDDGYTVVKDPSGFYVYADRDEKGLLVPTKQVAHEVSARDFGEKTFLVNQKKMLTPVVSPRTDSLRQTQRTQRAMRLAQNKAAQYDYSQFRGLILLVEFNDCSFKYSNYHDLMDDMANQENFKGNNQTGVCTGSVRDFYSDSSAGQFVPEFDVVGPIQIDYSMYGDKWEDMQNSGDYSYIVQLMADVATAADPEVDFSQYDGDNDGVVDLVYIVFAGMGSNFGGNDSRLIWPHQSDFYNPSGYPWYIRKDGKRLGHYACSTELYGTKQWNCLNGIGTITHEFGHVLGLPDFYDSDYEESGGQSIHPGEWTVMAGGGYLNYGRTPAVYTLFERYALGWAMPTVIDSEGSYTLESLDDCNTGYRLNTRVNKEYFMFENRQKVKWNAYLPGHGMLVFRVDSTNSRVWTSNKVNANPEHNYFELVRAGNKPNVGQSCELSSDPFPGTKKVRSLDNNTTPGNLKTWSGKESPLGLKNITESGGVITFDVIDVNMLTSISMEDSITMKVGSFYQLTVERDPDSAPYNFTWTSSNEEVCTVDDNGKITAVAAGQAIVTVTDDGPNHCTATCSVTVENVAMAQNIAELFELELGSDVTLRLDSAEVLMAHKGNIYLRDKTGHVMLSATTFQDIKTHDVLVGSIFGRFNIVDNIPLLETVEGQTLSNTFSVEGGQEPEPKVMYLAEATTADYGELVMLKAASLQKVPGKTGTYIIEGDNMVRVYNSFGLKLNSLSGITQPVDVTGILITRRDGENLLSELGMTKNPVVSSYPPYTEPTVTVGDANGDNKVNITDVTFMIDMINGEPSASFNESAADIDGNGVINITDVTRLIDLINAAKKK